MKRWLTCFILITFCLTALGQINVNRTYIFNRGNVSKLAQQINAYATSDSERVANIHYWITHHIKYDAKRSVKWQTANQETKKVLRRRKTLCSGYANLFQDLCIQSGVNAIVINGYAKNALTDICDTAYLPDHAWNKVEIDGDWYNIDNTWDAGYVEYYKTTFLRRLGASVTHGLIRPFIYKPHFIKSPTNQYYCPLENNFAVTHWPENSQLTTFQSTFLATDFSQDSAFYYYQNTLQNQQQVVSNSFFDTYASLDPIGQDKNDGENAQVVNRKNYFGSARFHYHNLFEAWQQYLDDPKAMKMDSVYLKFICTLSDSVLLSAYLNDSLIKEEYTDLSSKHRHKKQLQRTYNSDYVRYLKRKARFKSRQLNKIRNKKNRSSNRKKVSNKRYNRLLWRHFYKPGNWSKKPNQSKADSLAKVFQLYQDSLAQVAEQVANMQTKLRIQIDSLNKGIGTQINYIYDVTDHFDILTMMRINAIDDYDLPIKSVKADFEYYGDSDSSIQLAERYDAVYDLMDSLYRLGKKNYRYISRQRSVLKRVKRSTGWRMQYYSLSDKFRKNLSQSQSAEAAIQRSTKLQLKQMRRTTKGSAPIGLALTKCRTERQVALPLDIQKSKRRKNSNDNKRLKRFAKRTRTKAGSRLDVLRDGV